MLLYLTVIFMNVQVESFIKGYVKDYIIKDQIIKDYIIKDEDNKGLYNKGLDNKGRR